MHPLTHKILKILKKISAIYINFGLNRLNLSRQQCSVCFKSPDELNVSMMRFIKHQSITKIIRCDHTPLSVSTCSGSGQKIITSLAIFPHYLLHSLTVNFLVDQLSLSLIFLCHLTFFINQLTLSINFLLQSTCFVNQLSSSMYFL